MGNVDLHMHSVYSDGSRTPSELIEIGKAKGLKVMALTDHDEIEGSKEFVKLNSEGIYVYSGVELTAQVKKGRMHILGYNIDLDNVNLNKMIREMKEASIYNFMLYVELLRKKYNLVLPQDRIDEIIKVRGNIGRPHLALLLIDLGYCISVEDAFKKYLIPVYEEVRKIKKGYSKEECISIIKEASGVVSLAHPCSLKMDNDELDEEVAYLKSLGLDAIEVYHTNNKEKERRYYDYLANKYNLMTSGGSDFHGVEIKPDVMMGSGKNNNLNISEDTLTLTKKIKSRYMGR